jgi:hypothetical protein
MNNYYVIETLGQNVEYIITEVETDDGVKYELNRSLNDKWTDHCKGEVLVTMINDGNGYKFKWKQGEKKRLAYDEIEHLYLLINHVRRLENRIVYNVLQYKQP